MNTTAICLGMRNREASERKRVGDAENLVHKQIAGVDHPTHKTPPISLHNKAFAASI